MRRPPAILTERPDYPAAPSCLANLSLVEDGLERAKTRQSPLRYSYVRDENAVLAARDIPKFLDRAAEVLGRIEN